MDSDGMKKYINNFSFFNCKLGNQGYNRLLIQLFGFTGHGKSSFINSCFYVLKEVPYKAVAKVGKDKPETLVRTSYDLSRSIVLVDNRGFSKMNKDETGEIYAQLGNFTPLNSKVTWQKDGFESTINKLLLLEDEDNSSDFIVPVLVYSAQAGMSDQDFEELKAVVGIAKKITDIVPTVIVTHELSPKLAFVQEKFRQMGVKNRFSLENYTETDHLKTRGKHETFLSCLYGIIKDVEFRMESKRDPINEKKLRKKTLLSFIHERETEKLLQKAQQQARDAERRAQDAVKKAKEEEQKRKEAEDKNSCTVM